MNPAKQPSNDLAGETSPYLLQHAHNPVNWQPWREDAFALARRRDLPVFVSSGYSTCHWCHVMAHESFEDADTAAFLNENFVSIKLDREERPDIDHELMRACLAVNGSGGWPLSIFMDADKRVFFAGTYYPKSPRRGMISFTQLLTRVDTLWKGGRAGLYANADQIKETLAWRPEAAPWPEDMTERCFTALARTFDGEFGGFGNAPKFPTPHLLLFLLTYARTDKAALSMAEKTLDSMGRGGLFDQIGYGFCRYSTDRRWLIPHFEKMLYDNALLIMAYAWAFEATHAPEHRRAVEGTIQFLTREMASPQGGYYCAMDADSEGVEGKYYLWTPRQVEQVLGGDAQRYCRLYDITPDGNFEGKNIPNLIGHPLSEDERPFADACAEKLYAARNRRVRPATDDKILTSWNGLTMAALADAGRILGLAEYVEMAVRCWRFIKSALWRGGELHSSYREGQAKHLAHAEDYAYLLWGLLELYRATLDENYIEDMKKTAKAMDRLWDEDGGGFFYSLNPEDAGLGRSKPFEDGALPSPNSVAAWCLNWLALLTEDMAYQDRADALLTVCAREAAQAPTGHGFMILASMMRDQGRKLVIAAASRAEAEDMARLVKGDPLLALRLVVGEGAGYPLLQGKPTAYLCQGWVCLPPTNDVSQLKRSLEA